MCASSGPLGLMGNTDRPDVWKRHKQEKCREKEGGNKVHPRHSVAIQINNTAAAAEKTNQRLRFNRKRKGLEVATAVVVGVATWGLCGLAAVVCYAKFYNRSDCVFFF